MKRLTVQLIIAILLTMSGIVLLFSGFWIDPALEEFTYSRIAVENALDNTPPAAAKTALNHLVTYLLEPLRKFYKSPVAILSGYRSDAVNRLAGGVVASQHRIGEAADCYVATTGSSAKLRPPFRPGYLIQTPPFPASFLKAVRKEPDAGTCLYDLCYLFVSGLRIKKEHTPI